jgi:hypothetical protein
MLKAGILVGPLFVGLSLVLALASSGFDITKHEVSLLLVGNLGWLQVVNFMMTGLLGIICAFGLKRALKSGKASTWGPILLGVFGVLFIIAAIFHPDGHHGFPASAIVGIPVPPTAHANVHSMAFSFLALATVANGFVFARRYFATHRGWAVYSIVNSIAIVTLIAIGSVQTADGRGGLPLLGVAIAISFWVSAISARTLRDYKIIKN